MPPKGKPTWLQFRLCGRTRGGSFRIVKKVTGKKKILLVTFPQYTEFLEGFIRGMVVDYSENPVEGVLVRVGDPGEENSMFDPTVTNFNGIYRIRFSIPFDNKGRVDIRNKMVYAPDWEQKRDSLGNSYEPLEKETPFHLFYSRSSKLLAFSEGLRKSFVNPVQRGEDTGKRTTGSQKNRRKRKKKKTPAAGMISLRRLWWRFLTCPSCNFRTTDHTAFCIRCGFSYARLGAFFAVMRGTFSWVLRRSLAGLDSGMAGWCVIAAASRAAGSALTQTAHLLMTGAPPAVFSSER